MTKFALTLGASLMGVGAALAASTTSQELQPPFRIEAGGKPIDVDIGHAAPCVIDFDGDGIVDLLVGQFGDGKLRIYRNKGSNIAPKFDSFAWFQAGGTLGKVPAG